MRFASRDGEAPRLHRLASIQEEELWLVSKVRSIVTEQQVRPEDVLVLTFARKRAERLAKVLAAAKLHCVDALHTPFAHPDQPLGTPGQITISTVASAKGYDAFCVLLVSANEFPLDVMDRANFYVGCTRAIDTLTLSSYSDVGLVREVAAALSQSLPKIL